ncbi:MAG: hypothetical protein K2I08_12195, partial [Muribaculaceae bacterium]|nr:hypothetical protein [Muribaculaceae bacterium]
HHPCAPCVFSTKIITQSAIIQNSKLIYGDKGFHPNSTTFQLKNSTTSIRFPKINLQRCPKCIKFARK